jgi:hypothetical protein
VLRVLCAIKFKVDVPYDTILYDAVRGPGVGNINIGVLSRRTVAVSPEIPWECGRSGNLRLPESLRAEKESSPSDDIDDETKYESAYKMIEVAITKA